MCDYTQVDRVPCNASREARDGRVLSGPVGQEGSRMYKRVLLKKGIQQDGIYNI